MTSLTGLGGYLARSSPIPATNSHRRLPPDVLIPFPTPTSNRRRKINRFRCSVAKDSSATSSVGVTDSGSSSSFSSTSNGGGMLDCVIVGGGISGLCIAQALATRHQSCSNVVVTEATDRVGGNISTVEKDGYLWEEGPNSFQPSDPMLTMVVDCGLKDDLLLGDPTAPRFVLWGGKLKPVPSKPTDLPFFDLLSFPGKLRAGFGALGFRPSPPGCEESIEEFVRRNLGDEVFERLIEPFCSGVYAGDPSKLSMKAAFGKVWNLENKGGSIIGGAIKSIQERKDSPKPPRDPRLPKPKGQTVGSFKKGQAMLPNAISKRLGGKVKLSWKLSGIMKLENGGYSLTYETPNGLASLQSKTVVMTVPSYVASGLLRPISAAAADALSQFYYPPVAAVSVSYPKEAIRDECLIDGELKGFGQLHPRSQGVETLGTIYSSSLFPNRAPPGRILLSNYIGGATNPGILSKTESQLVEAVDRDLRTMLINPKAKDPITLGVRVWPQAIPQFLIGHYDILDAARGALRSGGFGGLFLGGNYVSGVALGRCVENAYEVATEIYVPAELNGTYSLVRFGGIVKSFLAGRVAVIALGTYIPFQAETLSEGSFRCNLTTSSCFMGDFEREMWRYHTRGHSCFRWLWELSGCSYGVIGVEILGWARTVLHMEKYGLELLSSNEARYTSTRYDVLLLLILVIVEQLLYLVLFP